MTWIRQFYDRIDKQIVFRAWAGLHRLAGKQVNKRADKYMAADENREAGWKEQALTDFRVWLSKVDDLPENAPLTDETSCDLYSLLAEFLSLKKQIQLQNREQSRQIRGLKGFNEFSERGGEILDRLGEQVDQLDKMVEKAGEAGRLETVKCFLDVRDPLIRGAVSARKAKGFIWAGREKRTTLTQGYEIALRKLDQAMAMTETFPIETQGCEFDPALMTAVDTRPADHGEKGMVLDEVCSGYIRRGRVIQPAQVIVSK